jgi:hypothetical protein
MALSMRFSTGRELTRGKQIDFAIRTLKQIDSEVYKEFTSEFRTEAKKIAAELKTNIPKRSPLSGMKPAVLAKRSAESNADYLDIYQWRMPTVKIIIGSRSRGGRRRSRPVVAIRFRDSRKTAGFSILELAGTKNPQGVTYRGRNMIQGLKTAGHPLNEGGRFVIPEFYRRKPEIMATAEKVLLKYSKRVSEDLAEKVRRAQRMAR